MIDIREQARAGIAECVGIVQRQLGHGPARTSVLDFRPSTTEMIEPALEQREIGLVSLADLLVVAVGFNHGYIEEDGQASHVIVSVS